MKRGFKLIQSDTIQLLHITDTHLLDHADDTFNGLNTKQSLEVVLIEALQQYPDVELLLFTGDISQTGDRRSYRIFRSIIQQFNLPVYCIPGNHDSPELLQEIKPDCPNNTISIIELGFCSLVLINSWVEDQNFGLINERSLQQLDDYLKKHPRQMAVIAVHHPPINVNSKWLDELGLKNRDSLLHIISNHPGNVLILSGHVHQATDSRRGNLHILTTPSTCYQFETNSDNMNRSDMPPAYRYISLTASHKIETRVHHVQQKFDMQQWPDIMERAGNQ